MTSTATHTDRQHRCGAGWVAREVRGDRPRRGREGRADHRVGGPERGGPGRVCRVLRRQGAPGGGCGCAVGFGVRVDGVRRGVGCHDRVGVRAGRAGSWSCATGSRSCGTRVLAGKLPLWRAGRVADRPRASRWPVPRTVDRHLAPVAHSCSWAQLDRTVEEAMVRFDPAAAEAKRREAAERQHVDVHGDQVSFDGTVHIDAEVDLADALDFEDVLRAGAKRTGSTRAALSHWTSAAPKPSATWPAASSRSGSKTPNPAEASSWSCTSPRTP